MWQRSWEQDVFPTVSDHSLVGGAHLKGARASRTMKKGREDQAIAYDNGGRIPVQFL